MTQSYINTLSFNELERLLAVYSDALEVFQIYAHWRNKELYFQKAYEADYRAISTHLEVNTNNFGQAKWSYMQFVEKLLKSFLLKANLTENNLRKKYGHSIKKLVVAFNDAYYRRN